MHPRRYDPDVQDPRAQLSDLGLLALGAVSRGYQVWRRTGYDFRDAHERVLSKSVESEAG